MDQKSKILEFVKYTGGLEGDEKGEAQLFLDRFFQAFGHHGISEAGAKLEHRVRRKDRGTSFADLYWQPRLLLEMKKRGEVLHRHYDQLRDYWHDIYPKSKYAVLCNFDEFWIYDFNTQSEPVDKVAIDDFPTRYTAFNFMLPMEKKPLFQNDMVSVSRAAADKVAKLFNSLIDRGESREISQRFVLQCVFSMFAEDFELLPRGMFAELVNDCTEGSSSYDLFGALFRQMNNPERAKGGRFRRVDYFNGGLFSKIDPIDLKHQELEMLKDAVSEDWSKVQPPIFGALFEGSLGKKERHALGAHFTHECDIKKIIRPTIERPWKEKIEQANTLKELIFLRNEMTKLKVLDPACGCGNFLYLAYRELKRLEVLILQKIHDNFKARTRSKVGVSSRISLHQFYGIDINPFAVELAKVTLMLGKEQSIIEAERLFTKGHYTLEIDFEKALPLDNLDNNIICDDALFCKWPESEAIIGNPPYQSKNKMVQEFGQDYVRKVREKYSDVSGRADYCVYWFRRAHDELKKGGRSGLVGTNTIRQTYSREGGLDYIINNGGTITDAISSQPWSGDAVVYVSLVNWIKGTQAGKKALIEEIGPKGKTTLNKVELDYINSSLSAGTDVSQAEILNINAVSNCCYQGQTHGHKGFLVSPEKAEELMKDSRCTKAIHPYSTGDNLLGNKGGLPSRFSIDLNHCTNILEAKQNGKAYEYIEKNVLPDIQKKAEEERTKLGKNSGPRQNHFKKWWKYWRGRQEMINHISKLSRYIVCARVTKRPIFEFVSSNIYPNDALQVFPIEDDYSFGVLQSGIHWSWFVARCSTLKEDYRYTSNTVFDSFPWPQSASISDVRKVANSAVNLRNFRKNIMENNGWNLRKLYRTLEIPGDNPLRNYHNELDEAVAQVYGMKNSSDPLNFLLKINLELCKKELRKEIIGPGLPPCVEDPSEFITSDCVKYEHS